MDMPHPTQHPSGRKLGYVVHANYAYGAAVLELFDAVSLRPWNTVTMQGDVSKLFRGLPVVVVYNTSGELADVQFSGLTCDDVRCALRLPGAPALA